MRSRGGLGTHEGGRRTTTWEKAQFTENPRGGREVGGIRAIPNN